MSIIFPASCLAGPSHVNFSMKCPDSFQFPGRLDLLTQFLQEMSRFLPVSWTAGPFLAFLQQTYPKNFRISVFLDFSHIISADKSKNLLVSLVFGLFLTRFLTICPESCQLSAWLDLFSQIPARNVQNSSGFLSGWTFSRKFLQQMSKILPASCLAGLFHANFNKKCPKFFRLPVWLDLFTQISARNVQNSSGFLSGWTFSHKFLQEMSRILPVQRKPIQYSLYYSVFFDRAIHFRYALIKRSIPPSITASTFPVSSLVL